jgi:hypothetical protein
LAEAFFGILGNRHEKSSMKMVSVILASFLLASPGILYFKYQRPLQSASSNGQHYVVVDETIWAHALPGLQDLRLYSAGKELPYALTLEIGNYAINQTSLRILQPGTAAGRTQFLLDMSGLSEYDRVTLTLSARNFVAHAKVEAQDDPHGNQWVTLGTTTLYDLSGEKLGHNTTLQIPLSVFKFLRVTVDNAIKPSDLEAASAATAKSEKITWREVSGPLTQTDHSRESVFTFSLPKGVPVDRIRFLVAPEQNNFSRNVQILGDKEQPLASGEISQIHLHRNGQRIDCEQTSLPVRLAGAGTYRIVVHNGDDTPLKIVSANLQQYERRIYFDADTGAQLRLYYGDDQLESPVYDYTKFFQKDAGAAQLQFEPEALNAVYSARPDARPWSERHPSVLWVAIIAAVLIMGTIAFRSLKSPAR